MPATFEPISTTTLGSAAASITFSSIPGTYTDLRLVVVAKATNAGTPLSIRFNSDSGTNYSRTRLRGNGTAASSNRATNDDVFALSGAEALSTTEWAMATVDIFSYAGSTNKTGLVQYSADFNGSGNVLAIVNLWRNTSAITTIQVGNMPAAGSDTLTAGTTATLYGILKA